MQKTFTPLAVLGLGLALTGCGNTLSGAKQDAANDTQKTQQAAGQAAQATKDAAHQAGQAVAAVPENAKANTVVRPGVKTAILRDPVLNDPRNLIDVNANAHGITLTGHVADASMKQRATEDAQVVLNKHPGYTLTNDLTVAGRSERVVYLLLPGRQIVHTRFQEEYLNRILGLDLADLPTIMGSPPSGRATDLVFAVTSCNKSDSRYNPLPFEIRAILVYEFARRLKEDFGVHFHVVGIPHSPPSDQFATRVLKEIAEQTEGRLTLTPANTVVFTSTPAIIDAYDALGFSVLPGEYDRATRQLTDPVPVAVVQQIGEGTLPLEQIPLSNSARAVFRNFPDAVVQIRRLYHDPLLTEQGDLTETRDYVTYTRAMAEAVDLKSAEIKPFLRPGKIVDEGCADGALLERVARDFPDSDLIGVDLSSEMLARAHEAQRAGAFGQAFVFFKQQNLMTPVSETQARSVDVVICNSTLHELWSYGNGDETVRAYLHGKFKQLRHGGRLVIRDVVGPDDKDSPVLMECATDDGLVSDDTAVPIADLSTFSRFGRFCQDFRSGTPRPGVEVVTQDGQTRFRLTLGLAMEFIAKMTYADNWLSEMHEAFCFWSFADWARELEAAGFSVLPASHAYVNDWRVAHHFEGRVALFDLNDSLRPFPVTNMALAAVKPNGTE